ncbi:MAG TPA: hydroxymethylpyrimidine/phosphomethylpyrimidine kinase [Kofleriaceae bacterium]|jgi:hydroxymethylpyrimidine kinase/phosphomethylpyrimidine kinase
MIDPSAPDVLIVSGLDPSGGAGFIADTRVVHELGGRPCGVISALTVQDTHGVRSITAVEGEALDDQMAALLADVEIKAVKLGMIASLETTRILDDHFAATTAPIVWDPILGPSHGAALDPMILIDAMQRLAKHVALITPNLRELALLAGQEPFARFEDAITAAQKIASVCKLAVLVKGGHALDGAPTSTPPVRPGIADAPEGLTTFEMDADLNVPELATSENDARESTGDLSTPPSPPPSTSTLRRVTPKPLFVDVGDASFDLRAESIDVLVTTSGIEVIRGVRHATSGNGSGVHGTGCALSSAIATLLARGSTLSAACREAKQFVGARIAAPVRPGRGAPSVL